MPVQATASNNAASASSTSVPSTSKPLSRSVSSISNASSNQLAERAVSVANPPKTPVAKTPTNFLDDLRNSQANRASSSTLASAESITSIADQIDKAGEDKIRKSMQSKAGNLAPWQQERLCRQQSKKRTDCATKASKACTEECRF